MQAFEWVSINKSLQGSGFATCDVGQLLVNADELRANGHRAAAFMVASAARDVLRHRQMARQRMAGRIFQNANRRRAKREG